MVSFLDALRRLCRGHPTMLARCFAAGGAEAIAKCFFATLTRHRQERKRRQRALLKVDSAEKNFRRSLDTVEKRKAALDEAEAQARKGLKGGQSRFVAARLLLRSDTCWL